MGGEATLEVISALDEEDNGTASTTSLVTKAETRERGKNGCEKLARRGETRRGKARRVKSQTKLTRCIRALTRALINARSRGFTRTYVA